METNEGAHLLKAVGLNKDHSSNAENDAENFHGAPLAQVRGLVNRRWIQGLAESEIVNRGDGLVK
jgi:hypothetical protein